MRKMTKAERVALQRAIGLRADLRYWRDIEKEVKQQSNVFNPIDTTRLDVEVSYNACGDPYGCGCGTTTLRKIEARIIELKSELAALPHIPNGAERKRLRREHAENRKGKRGKR